ncbi:MAG TPA: hypothetical protein DCS85_09655 [Verrucomicrobiales bacterium]|nr:hypothetical protein [Deltaproteobacteria bacterium]HAT20406.1 hypothetical protein [Verrucomicrobiales bacterium]
MIGLRRVLLHPGWCFCILASCASEPESELPIAGTPHGSDRDVQSLYARAQAADQSGKSKRAISLYGNTADKNPHSSVAPAARFRQAQLLEQRDKLDKAFETYQMVITLYQASSLYAKARDSQARLAHAVADGQISDKLLWFKTAPDIKKIVSMLATVRDNAPRAPSAAKAQHAIGRAYESKKSKANEAITAYQDVVDNYPRSLYAPEAQYKIGQLLTMGASKGNQDNSNLDRAQHAFEDLHQSYPNSKRAADAATKIAEIRSREIQRNFDIAEFYFKKEQNSSAAVYYREVVRKTTGGPLHDRAKVRLQSIGTSE